MYIVETHPLAPQFGDRSVLERLLGAIQSPLALWDPDGNLILFNDAFRQTLQYEPDAASRLKRRDLIHPDERDEADRIDGSSEPGDLNQRRSWRLLTGDGRVVEAEYTSAEFSTADGITGELVVYREAADQQGGVLDFGLEEFRLRWLFENGSVAIFSTDAQNHFETANPACLRLLELTLDELRQLTPLDLVHPDHRAAMLHRRETRGAHVERAQDPIRIPVQLGGQRFVWFTVVMLPRFDADGVFVGTDGFARNASAGVENSAAS